MGKKILVVDDEPDVVTYLCAVLRDNGYEAMEAYDGEEALAKIASDRPDLVTLDITMPGLCGFEVLEEMIRINQNSRIIVVTSLSDKETGLKALKMGASSYLNKPFGAQKFKAAFERLIEDTK